MSYGGTCDNQRARAIVRSLSKPVPGRGHERCPGGKVGVDAPVRIVGIRICPCAPTSRIIARRGWALSSDSVSEKFEQTARVLGERWARRLRSAVGSMAKDLILALGRARWMKHDTSWTQRLEANALERGANLWFQSSSGAHEQLGADPDVTQERAMSRSARSS